MNVGSLKHTKKPLFVLSFVINVRFHSQTVKLSPAGTSLQFSVSAKTRTVFENPRATQGISASYFNICVLYRLKPDELELPSTQELEEYLTKNQKKGENALSIEWVALGCTHCSFHKLHRSTT